MPVMTNVLPDVYSIAISINGVMERLGFTGYMDKWTMAVRIHTAPLDLPAACICVGLWSFWA